MLLCSFLLLMHRLIESHYVTEESKIVRPFYVIVSQPFMSNTQNVLDLHDGDIFICTFYNKVGHWWGVSVYDLQRQGWFPSTLVQPYAGEVPEEAAEFLSKIKVEGIKGEEPAEEKTDIVFNIVKDDDDKYQEYEVSGVVQRVGRRTRIGEQVRTTDDPSEEVDFDYETWAAEKNASKEQNEVKKPRNSYR